MKSKRSYKPVQIVEGVWYALGYGSDPFVEECCDCGLVHRITYKIDKGRIWHSYKVDRKLTRQARAIRKRLART